MDLQKILEKSCSVTVGCVNSEDYAYLQLLLQKRVCLVKLVPGCSGSGHGNGSRRVSLEVSSNALVNLKVSAILTNTNYNSLGSFETLLGFVSCVMQSPLLKVYGNFKTTYFWEQHIRNNYVNFYGVCFYREEVSTTSLTRATRVTRVKIFK